MGGFGGFSADWEDINMKEIWKLAGEEIWAAKIYEIWAGLVGGGVFGENWEEIDQLVPPHSHLVAALTWNSILENTVFTPVLN